ncbi:MAG: TetR/AcrR family transcriptional regulator [Pseudodesulfovibrio sp.]
MSETTKQRIIEAGAKLIHQRGFNNTGLKDILKAADVPKGSFYFYFENKEAFGIEAVDYYADQFRISHRATLRDETRSPLERFRAFFEASHTFFEEQGFTRGCPIANLAQEMGDLSEPFRAKLNQAMDGLTAAFMYILKEAQKAGEVPADMNIRETATFIVAAYHGALLRMKVTKNEEPLNLCYKFVFEKLLK